MEVVKVTCSTKKIVLLRQPKIKHTELAAQEVASRANGDANVLSLLMQKALLKQLVVQVNDKAVTARDLEDMDDMFSLAEYNQLMTVVKKLMGGDETGKEPSVEFVNENSGDK